MPDLPPARVDWSFTKSDGYTAGTIVIDQREWNLMTPETRRRTCKARVAARVIKVLNVDWQPTNAHYEEGN